MLKLDSLLWADPPALSAAGALGHIVTECSPIVPIGITQGRSRTIFHTGQAPVAFLVDAKVRHTILQRDLKKLAKPQVLKNQIPKLKFQTFSRLPEKSTITLTVIQRLPWH